MSEPSAISDLQDAMWPPEEAERSYVAALLQRDDANEVMWRSMIEPLHFESGEFAAIYEAMLVVRDRGERVQFLSVGEQLANVRLETTMWNSTNHWANPGFVEHFAEQILARFRRRSYGMLGSTITEVAATRPNSELDTAVEEVVDSVMNQPAIESTVATGVTLNDRIFGEREDVQGVPTPWPRLDRAIKGIRRGQLYTLSGDTGSGKSAIALQFAYSLSRVGTCLYFTMEMSEGEMQDRLVAQQTGTALDMVEKQHFPVGPVRDKVAAFVQGPPVSIVFSEAQRVNVAEIRRTALGTENLSGIVVDQLALMDFGETKGQNLADVIARTTSALKAMAAALDVPVILVSQLNREAARSGRPTRHHLYGSSAIANDAGVILILHREDLSLPHALTMIVDKNRFGEPAQIELEWQGEFVRAVDPSA